MTDRHYLEGQETAIAGTIAKQFGDRAFYFIIKMSPPPACTIGLGSSTFGREIDRVMAFKVLDRALECGLAHIDTAALYSAGQAEQIIGAWWRDRRPSQELTIATKMYPPYTAATIRAACELALRQIQRDRIDVFYFHKWDESAVDPEALRELERLRRAGIIGGIGASNFDAEQTKLVWELQEALGLWPLSYVQNMHNFAVREVTPALRTYCQGRGIKIVTYSPMGAGFLSGKHRAAIVAGSRFDFSPDHRNIYFTPVSLARLEVLEEIASKEGLSPGPLALAWALHQPGVDMVLIGCRIPAHIDQAIMARQFHALDTLAALDNC